MDVLADQSRADSRKGDAHPVNLSAVIIAPTSLRDSPLLKNVVESVAFADEVIINRTKDDITDFSMARNEALSKANGDWVFFVDSDEEVTESLAQEIQRVVHQSPITNYQLPIGFLIRRQDFFLGRWLKHGETGHARFLRLARKDAGTWVRPVHERWVVNGPVGALHHPLLHRPHQSVVSMLEKIERYAEIDALYRKQRTSLGLFRTIIEMMLFPKAKFIENYIFRLGWLDGFPGFVMALMMSFHSFLVRAIQLELKLDAPMRHDI